MCLSPIIFLCRKDAKSSDMLINCLRKIPIIIACFFLLSSYLNAGYYKWIDEQGYTHFTDNHFNIPDKYREEVSQSKYGRAKGLKSLSKNTPQRVVVHFKRKDNAIFVNAILNWKLPVVFHLDTGASNTMITKQDALALGIDPDKKPKVKCYIADGSLVEFPRAMLSSVSVGDAEVNNVEVVVGNVRLLGMNFLNEFNVQIDAENGQLVMARKDVVKENESPSIRKEKNHTISELYNHIDQIEIAIKAKENVIKEIKSDIELGEEKRAEVESVLTGTMDSTRFESSDISFDSSKKRRIEKYKEVLARVNRRIEIRRDEIRIQKKQIDQLKERIDHYDTLISKLR